MLLLGQYQYTIGALTSSLQFVPPVVRVMISFLYDRKHSKKAYLKEYKDLSKSLKIDDFDRYWLFIYETLSWTELTDNYKIMKKNGITFIKPEFN